MSPGNFRVSYSAVAQLAMLPAAEKAALKRLFATAEVEGSHVTKATGDGRFVSKLGMKRILWRKTPRQKPEILAIVDQSFANTK